MEYPSLEELAFMPADEAETAIRAALPPQVRLNLELQDNQWVATLTGLAEEVYWTGYSPDRRVLVFDAYDQILQAVGVQPKSVIWQRKGEVQIPVQIGNLAYQGNVQVPDPEDLKPEELLKIYGLLPKDEHK